MAPLWATNMDFGVRPKGFQGSQQSTWLPACLKSCHSVSVQPPWTLWLAFPSVSRLHVPLFRLRNQTALFPSPTWPCEPPSVIMPCLLIWGSGLNTLDDLSEIKWLVTESGQSTRLKSLGSRENNTGYLPSEALSNWRRHMYTHNAIQPESRCK